MTIEVKLSRMKHDNFSFFYILPAIVFENWDTKVFCQDTFYFRWLTHQLSICLYKRKEDYMKK